MRFIISKRPEQSSDPGKVFEMGKFDNSEVIQRFLRYVAVDTESSETSGQHPSTEKQKDLGRILYRELQEMGASDVVFDEEHNYVYAKIPATDGGKNPQVLGFIAHMDTSPETSGANVKARIVEDYDGGDILLSKENGLVLSPKAYPEMLDYVGQSLIVTDGNTLLGSDDKSGVAEIMTMANYLLTHPSVEHGTIAVAFTPDEEIGEGVDFFDKKQFGANVAYTVDGGALGELEYENFNAASLKVLVHGVTVHPGEAKNKMKHAGRIAMEFESMLPAWEKPEYTEKYEGFFYLTEMSGDTESATLHYIIRDHDRQKFESKKRLAQEIAIFLNAKYGMGTVEIEIRDSYFNMKEKIEPEYLYLVENAKAAMEKLGIVPKVQPIRGGTDGARLSYDGLPTPNLCAGGHNFHGRFEYCCAESMEKIVELLVELATS